MSTKADAIDRMHAEMRARRYEAARFWARQAVGDVPESACEDDPRRRSLTHLLAIVNREARDYARRRAAR